MDQSPVGFIIASQALPWKQDRAFGAENQLVNTLHMHSAASRTEMNGMNDEAKQYFHWDANV